MLIRMRLPRVSSVHVILGNYRSGHLVYRLLYLCVNVYLKIVSFHVSGLLTVMFTFCLHIIVLFILCAARVTFKWK